ncbi:MAG: hypothetical protein OEX02_16830 [Cyclobacteriaceae bacterium]|nr:hypothetical protein [Cyclobacteriaceae bacterium]
MEAQITYTLRLKKLHCYLSDEDDADEVFIKHAGKKIWPEGKFIKMKSGATDLNVELKVVKEGKVEFEIWDYDFLTPNDLLGTFMIRADSMGGPYTTDMIKKDKGTSKYALEWELM